MLINVNMVLKGNTLRIYLSNLNENKLVVKPYCDWPRILPISIKISGIDGVLQLECGAGVYCISSVVRIFVCVMFFISLNFIFAHYGRLESSCILLTWYNKSLNCKELRLMFIFP